MMCSQIDQIPVVDKIHRLQNSNMELIIKGSTTISLPLYTSNHCSTTRMLQELPLADNTQSTIEFAVKFVTAW